MAVKQGQKKIHIDNMYLIKKFDEDYHRAFERFYDYVLDLKKSDADKNIIINIGIQRCLDGMKANKKASLVIPKDLKDFCAKLGKGPVYKDMKTKMRNQDYEKLHIASIWMVFSLCLVLFFLRNLMNQDYTINYIVDVIVGCVAGAIAFQNFMIKRRIIKRYQFDSFYIRLDVITLIACIFVKIISKSNFDITYLLLVISFFVMKKKIKADFEKVI